MKTHENTKSVMKKITLAICFLTAVCVAKPQQTNNREEVRKYRIQAQAAYSDGDFEEALADYKKAQNLDPQNPEFFKAIGDVYEKLGGTGNLMEAKASYERYLELAPKAADGREIQDRVYVLERQIGKSQKTDDFLNDLSGTWVAMDNLTVGVFYYTADFVFEISRFQQTDTYRVTIIPKGSRYYSEGIIDKTVNIVPQKDQSFNFTFADAQVHTPNQGKYSALRLGAEVAGALSGKSWVSDATNVAIDMKQSNDLPSNTQTAYIFALKYIDGNLKGLVNVVQKYADPTQQRTLKDGLYEITFIKKNQDFYNKLKETINDRGDILYPKQGFTMHYTDKDGKVLSEQEILNKLNDMNPYLAESYQKAKKRESLGLTISFIGVGVEAASLIPIIIGGVNENKQLQTLGWSMFGGGIGVAFLVGFPIGMPGTNQAKKAIDQYNQEVKTQLRNRPLSQLYFGVSSSGGVGFTFKF